MAGILIYICGCNIHKTDFKPNCIFINNSMRHNARVKRIGVDYRTVCRHTVLLLIDETVVHFFVICYDLLKYHLQIKRFQSHFGCAISSRNYLKTLQFTNYHANYFALYICHPVVQLSIEWKPLFSPCKCMCWLENECEKVEECTNIFLTSLPINIFSDWKMYLIAPLTDVHCSLPQCLYFCCQFYSISLH